MTEDDARELLYTTPKEQTLPPAAFDRTVKAIREGRAPALRFNEHGEIVLGGGITIDGDTAPTFRWSRESESPASTHEHAS